jgi:hypothetical protein
MKNETITETITETKENKTSFSYDGLKEVKKAKQKSLLENYKAKAINEGKKDTIGYKSDGLILNDDLQNISNKITIDLLKQSIQYDIVKTQFRNVLLNSSEKEEVNKILCDTEIKGVFDLEVLKPNFPVLVENFLNQN